MNCEGKDVNLKPFGFVHFLFAAISLGHSFVVLYNTVHFYKHCYYRISQSPLTIGVGWDSGKRPYPVVLFVKAVFAEGKVALRADEVLRMPGLVLEQKVAGSNLDTGKDFSPHNHRESLPSFLQFLYTLSINM